MSSVEIKDRGSGDVAATATNQYRPTPVFPVKTKDRDLNDQSGWGGFVEFSEGHIKADHQRVGGQRVNLGTALSAIVRAKSGS